MRRVTNFRVLVIWVLVFVPGLVYAQSNYPGAALFRYVCQGEGIQFFYQEAPALQVTLNDIAAPLASAISVRHNLPIKTAGEISLWALQSNELQIHRNADPDSSKMVYSSTICGEIPSSTPAPQPAGGVALAYVQLDGPGRALALAAVTASGQVAAYAQVLGSGYALALAQSGGAAAGGIHVVQPGENLFRIALRYGTTVSILAALNHISNPRLIYVGQTIVLP